MSYVEIIRDGSVAVLAIRRGKVNALNEALVAELVRHLAEVEQDEQLRAAVLTGRGSFFSFGFDVPELFSYTPEEFTRFLVAFTGLYTRLFTFPKPVVAALNGHAIAGGCMLALACDRRILARGRGRISLNEIEFGSSVFAGSVEMLKVCVGHRSAEAVLFGGAMYDADRALAFGLVDRVVEPGDLEETATGEARELGGKHGAAFRATKSLLRDPIAEEMRRGEGDSIRRFVDVWYSEPTREELKKIVIRT